MYCPGCRARVASGSKFCGDCGTALPWFCQVCGGENAPRSHFCGACGAPGASAAGRVPGTAAGPALGGGEPERRHLTVVFADLVGSTDLSARLDPEDLRDVMNAWQNCVSALIVRYGGLVTRHMGDGILALFGYPRAHEIDAERAVRVGLAIIEAAGRLGTIAGPAGTLSTRVGLATGLVIVGDLIGAGSSLEWSVVGETPNLAARLQTLARPDMLIIDQVTRQLTGEMFEYSSLGLVALKGIPAPVRAWAVVRENFVESRFQALRSGPLPLVGREQETGLMQRRWAEARSGVGQMLVIVGEPGLGKSRLIAAFEETLGDSPRSVLHLACSPHYQDSPLYPVIRYFESAADFQRADSPDQKRAKLKHLLRNTGDLTEPEMAALTDLLSVAPTPRMPDRQTPQVLQELTFKGVLRHLQALAATAPLLAVVEDFHWIDPTTTALLHSLVREGEHLSAFLIVSSRTDSGLPQPTCPHITTQLLNGIDRSQATVLVRNVAGETAVDDDLVARIVERAAGVPLFIEELTRSVLSSGLTAKEGDPPSPVLLHDDVPTSLKALLTARLDQLGPGKEVAQASSVIGREFSFEMLHAVSGLPAERLEQALDELEQARLIVPTGPRPGAMYVFHHVLIQDAAYASMLRDRRRGFHLRYAEALEKDPTGAASTAPELLAAQFAEAGVAEKSIDYYLKAASRATGRFALTEIVGYLQKGLHQLASLPITPATQHRELELLVARGRALMEYRGAGDQEVRVTFERAHDLCIALGETELRLHVHDGLANYHLAHSELDKVVEYGERALEVGQRTGNRHAVVLAHRSRGHGRLLQGRFHEAREDLEQALEKYEGEMAITRDPKVSVCGALGICLTALGLPESGTAMNLNAVRHAEALAHPISLNLALRRACIQAMMRHDAENVTELSGRLLSNQSNYETFRGSREGLYFSAWARLHTNRDPALRQQVRTMLAQFDDARSWNFLPFFMLSAAELMEFQGDSDGADAMLRRAAELVESTSERWCEAEIPRLRARLTSDPVAAADLLQTSLAVSRGQGALLWEVRAATDLAKLLQSQGSHDAARGVLAPVLARVSEGGTLPAFRVSRELLQALTSGAVASANAVPTGDTACLAATSPW